jgi:hypothetical protein
MVATARGFCVDFAGKSRYHEEPPSWPEPAEKDDGATDVRMSGEAKETRVPRPPIGHAETSVAKKVPLTVRFQSGRRLFGPGVRHRLPMAVIAICVVRTRAGPRSCNHVLLLSRRTGPTGPGSTGRLARPFR